MLRSSAQEAMCLAEKAQFSPGSPTYPGVLPTALDHLLLG